METKASLDGLKMSSHFSKKAKEQVTGGSIKHVEDQLKFFYEISKKKSIDSKTA